MKIVSIVGARPNFIKVAALHRAFISSLDHITSKIIHTGQHFDEKMSKVFFDDLELPVPDYFLGVGHGTHSEVTARIMLSMEPILIQENPDLLLVVGDVTSTFAAALVAQRNGIKVAHVEAGLRSHDRTMPEEINRLLTDQISDYLFVTEKSALNNLVKENITDDKVFMVGNCMIDSLVFYQSKTEDHAILDKYNLQRKSYILMTIHRPSNVDHPKELGRVLELIEKISQVQKVIFPLHPRTKNKLQLYGLFNRLSQMENVVLTEPLPYLEFINLMRFSSMLLTDSGGIQEESTFLGIPCITFRSSTERPVTVELGTNILMNELDVEQTLYTSKKILNGEVKQASIPPLWDGKAAFRIRDILIQKFQ